MWTILVNYDEYAEGIYNNECHAQQMLWAMVEEDTNDTFEDYEEAFDACSGYYRVLEIKGV